MKKAAGKPARPKPAQRRPDPDFDRPTKPLRAPSLWDQRAAIVAILVALSAVLAFARVAGNQFAEQWDDQANFLQNLNFRGLGWPQIRWAWGAFLLGVYQPLAWMLLETEYALGGLDPSVYHVTSLLLHAVNAVLLYLLTLALLARAMPDLAREHKLTLQLASGLAVALFAAHPLRTEVVAWASCQPYLPCAALAMISVLTYLRACDETGPRRTAWYTASLLTFAAALLSKAVAMSLPVILVILDVYPLRRLKFGRGTQAQRVLIEKVPYFALSAVFMLIALQARKHSLRPIENYGLPARLAQSAYGLAFYLRKTLAPFALTAYNTMPERLDPAEPRFILSALLVLVLAVAAILLRKRWPGVLAALLAYAAILAPNLGFVQTSDLIVADRYSYFAMTGLTVLLAAALAQLALRGQTWAIGVATIGLIVLIGLITLSESQTRTWHDQEALWTQGLAVGTARDADLHSNLGSSLVKHGKFDEGMDHLREAVRLKPDLPSGRNNLGLALILQKRYPEAAAELTEAIRLNPSNANARDNLGKALESQGRFDEAIVRYAEALQLKPDFAEAHHHLGNALAALGRYPDALTAQATAVRLQPGYAEAHHGLGVALERLGRMSEAESQVAEAVRLKPDYAVAHNDLGILFARRHQIDAALEQFTEAVRLQPNYPEAHLNLGAALYRKGRLREAESEFAEAVRLKPDYAEARHNLNAIRAKLSGQGKP